MNRDFPESLMMIYHAAYSPLLGRVNAGKSMEIGLVIICFLHSKGMDDIQEDCHKIGLEYHVVDDA